MRDGAGLCSLGRLRLADRVCPTRSGCGAVKLRLVEALRAWESDIRSRTGKYDLRSVLYGHLG